MHRSLMDRGFVGDEQVHEAIVVDVGRNYAQTLAKRRRNGSALADFFERAITIVVEKKTGTRAEHTRHAVVISADFIVATLQLFYAGVVDKVANEKIEFAIIVVVEPDSASRPTRSRQP